MEQLLWFETLIKGAIGTCLVLSPKMIIRLFALPDANSAFWPRLVGALLLGLAAVTFMSGAKLINDGIGAIGLATLNFSAAIVLLGSYFGATASIKRRGKTLVGFLGVALCLLAIAEILLR